MSRLQPILFSMICFFVLTPLAAQAETLTDQTVLSFINSLEAMQGMEDEYDDLPDELATQEDDLGMEQMSRIFSSSVESMKGHPLYNDLAQVVSNYGFSSPEQWGETGDRILRAWSAIEMGQQSGGMNQEMAKAMEEIDNNPNISEAQKQQMREMMGGAQSMMDNASSAPEADKQAVRPHLDALRSATSESGGS
jgi:hypothetical protein